MRRTLTAIALSTLFAAAPAFAQKHHVAKGSTSSSSSTVAGDSASKPAEGKTADSAAGGDATKSDKPVKKTRKNKKSAEKTEGASGSTALAEGTPAK